jgi:hypothetical protein
MIVITDSLFGVHELRCAILIVEKNKLNWSSVFLMSYVRRGSFVYIKSGNQISHIVHFFNSFSDLIGELRIYIQCI